MNSLDTNLLYYALNTDCTEHAQCRALVESALQTPHLWLVADQVWFELYRLLRNPTIQKSPLSAAEAASTIRWFRENSGWGNCAWEPFLMDRLQTYWRDSLFPARRTFDLILAITLQAHQVTHFYTRNTKDFASFEFLETIDPLV